MNHRIYNTGNGEETIPFKIYDGITVPVGFFYESDIQSIRGSLKLLLTTSISPLIERLVDVEIGKHFEIDDLSFNAKLYAGSNKSLVETDSLMEGLRKINEKFEFYDSHNLDFFINISFEIQEAEERSSYGCQIHVMTDSKTVQDVESEQEYQVWYLYMGHEKTNIEIPFESETENKIIEYFIDCLIGSKEKI